MMRMEPSAEFFDRSKIHAAIKSQDRQLVGESLGILSKVDGGRSLEAKRPCSFKR
jgi:hypothetical protein